MHTILPRVLISQWNSIQDALRAFLPPIKNEDTRLDFHTVYKGEATEHDTDYVKKYDEDLNTTLIFVCYPPFTLTAYLAYRSRPAYSPPSVRRLSSTFNQISVNSPHPCHPPHP